MRELKKKIFNIIQIGNKNDIPSTLFDYGIITVIAINLFVTLFSTFEASAPYRNMIDITETITVIIFTVEYVLRLWTSDRLYPNAPRGVALLKYIFSFYGLIELLTFLPFYLPFIFPAGAVAFRMFRVIRILRLFKINAQYDAFNVIISVLKEKRNQLLSSIAMILILMASASLCMYSLEHDVQPEQFQNAFSGIWWATSTLLTIGYGDIYPVTIAGKIMAIIIAFLGVGMVAIPTGIISAGFVEQYTRVRDMPALAPSSSLELITYEISADHPWANKALCDIKFPQHEIVAMIVRGAEELIPHGATVILPDDNLIIYKKR